jgi:ketosteroid isomerase-like protein
MQTAQEILDFAEHFVSALERGDAETARACYWPDAKIWHNTDKVEQTVDQNLKALAWFARTLPERRYRIVRREALSDGFLQQHVLETTLPDGRPFTLHACCVIKMKNGKITRLDEYIDSAETKPLSEIGR